MSNESPVLTNVADPVALNFYDKLYRLFDLRKSSPFTDDDWLITSVRELMLTEVIETKRKTEERYERIAKERGWVWTKK